ncbi:MAG: hypothetical protein WA666_07170 [Nitrospirota bacterium]
MALEYQNPVKSEINPPHTGYNVFSRSRYVSWGAIFAGTFVALTVQVMLTLLGLAVRAFNPVILQNTLAAGVGVDIWLIVSSIISLFVGGLVAGMMLGIRSPLHASLHGLAVWGLCTIFSLYMVGTALGMLVGGSSIIVARGINFLSSGLTGAGIMANTLNTSIAAVIAVFLSGLAAIGGGSIGARSVKAEATIEEEEKKLREERREFPRAA